jgi:hypothetical protein
VSSFNLGVEPGIITRRVSEDEASIHGIPRLRFGLLFLALTLILKLDTALARRAGEGNGYPVLAYGDEIAGFVSATPPGHGRYSIDKYVSRDELPFTCDDGLFEVRILTVWEQFRASPIAGLLMYAAFRWIKQQRGTRVMAIGRLEVLGVYLKLGLKTLGRTIRSEWSLSN